MMEVIAAVIIAFLIGWFVGIGAYKYGLKNSPVMLPPINKYDHFRALEIEKDIKRAIPLPDCPVKKEHAIASRIWLEKKINEYITTVKNHYEKSGKEPEY